MAHARCLMCGDDDANYSMIFLLSFIFATIRTWIGYYKSEKWKEIIEITDIYSFLSKREFFMYPNHYSMNNSLA